MTDDQRPPSTFSALQQLGWLGYLVIALGVVFAGAALVPEGGRRVAVAVLLISTSTLAPVVYRASNSATVKAWGSKAIVALWALPAIALTSALVLALFPSTSPVTEAVATPTTSGSASSPSPSATRFRVQTLPAGAIAPSDFGVNGAMIPLPLAEIPRPPDSLEGINAWVDDLGGAFAYSTTVSFSLDSDTVAPVYISNIRARVLERRPPIAGTLVAPPGAGAVTIRTLSLDLDDPAARPEIQPQFLTGETWSFPLRIRAGDDEVVVFSGYTTQYDVSWVIELDYLLDGDEITVEITDDGEPFRTSASTAATARAVIPEDASAPWPPVTP